jgi:hypothetical protein
MSECDSVLRLQVTSIKMLLLPFVRTCIAEFNDWPSEILSLLVCEEAKITRIRDVCIPIRKRFTANIRNQIIPICQR